MPLPDLVRHEATNPSEFAPYPNGLALDLALKTAPIEQILEAYRLTPDDFVRIAANPNFKQEYKSYCDMAKEEGFSFRMKARAQAEEMLKVSWNLVHDAETPASVRADLIKHTTKIAGLEPKPTAADDGAKEKITITINLGDQTKVIDGTATTVEK